VVRRRALWRRLLVAALVVLSLAMLTVFFREQANGALHRAQHLGAQVLEPLQAGSAKIIKPFRDAWNWVGDLFTAKSDNKRLQKEVATLRMLVARQLATEQENEQLRSLLGLTKDPIYDQAHARLVPGRVIARSSQVWYSRITINVGSADGVAVYDPVVNGQGLVGRVTEVTTNAAEVTLLTDQDSYVDAKVLGAGGEMLAEGVVAGGVEGDVRMLFVNKEARLQVGQYVVTSGRAGSIFIPGIPVGVVENVGRQDVALYQNVSLTPLVDFHKLDLVMVVVR
jgi:rod shape-determining protein MreC